MTAAVIMTTPIKNAQFFMCNKSKLVDLIFEIKPYFSEIILISDRPSSYLPYVKDSARILTPYYKGNSQLASLYTALSLSSSENVWLLHEKMQVPDIQLFSKIKALKDRKNSPAVIFDQKDKESLLYSMFDKRVINDLNKILTIKNHTIEQFINQITYTDFTISEPYVK
ncbi:hypothetical protein [Bacillus sp. NEB1478]|uniref:hypothetical protein n=1 Tax=Bacillus sp. NEB1478 TaxID=3073816 RepID=UPI0028737B82|nr:hypothetical protein [Bacillus sp. NEB1478]WNB93188.1 hypothetical protein RGB74_05820 [Bacillus sp. NEB1478]